MSKPTVDDARHTIVRIAQQMTANVDRRLHAELHTYASEGDDLIEEYDELESSLYEAVDALRAAGRRARSAKKGGDA